MNDDSIAGGQSSRARFNPPGPGIDLAAIVVASLYLYHFQPMIQFDESLSCCHSTW